MVGVEGLEPPTLTTDSSSDLRNTPEQSGAKSGALAPESGRVPPDLAAFVKAWSALPESARAAALDLLRQAKDS